MNSKTHELEDRLITFAVSIIKIVESLPPTKAGNHLGSQMVRSGTSPALNYGEAQGAESRGDFIHKLRVVLKELRETSVALRIAERLCSDDPRDCYHEALEECDELISIFVTSVKTASRSGTRNNEAK
jgi:four helix bundle protein